MINKTTKNSLIPTTINLLDQLYDQKGQLMSYQILQEVIAIVRSRTLAGDDLTRFRKACVRITEAGHHWLVLFQEFLEQPYILRSVYLQCELYCTVLVDYSKKKLPRGLGIKERFDAIEPHQIIPDEEFLAFLADVNPVMEPTLLNELIDYFSIGDQFETNVLSFYSQLMRNITFWGPFYDEEAMVLLTDFSGKTDVFLWKVMRRWNKKWELKERVDFLFMFVMNFNEHVSCMDMYQYVPYAAQALESLHQGKFIGHTHGSRCVWQNYVEIGADEFYLYKVQYSQTESKSKKKSLKRRLSQVLKYYNS